MLQHQFNGTTRKTIYDNSFHLGLFLAANQRRKVQLQAL